MGLPDPIGALRSYLDSPARQIEGLERRDHRPWPMPVGDWMMAQSWHDLLFCHWRTDESMLRHTLPDGIEIDTFDGEAWIGVTPFVVDGVRLRGTLPAPLASRFPEINVRTYVRVQGKPGIWFFSLDTSSQLAVRAARSYYHLPYFHARMSVQHDESGFVYRSVRRPGAEGGHQAEFRGVYDGHGTVDEAAPGTLEHFVAERYCLYTVDDRGHILRGEIHHPPWPLQPAVAALSRNTMVPPSLTVEQAPPLVHFARRQDVLIWAPRDTGLTTQWPVGSG